MGSRQAFLTLGTLLGRHCRNYPNECHYDKNSQISRAQIYLMDLLENKCKKQDKPEKLEEYIMSLKETLEGPAHLRPRWCPAGDGATVGCHVSAGAAPRKAPA